MKDLFFALLASLAGVGVGVLFIAVGAAALCLRFEEEVLGRYE